MNNYIFGFLILLQVKHWYIDFVNQSYEEIANKGNYLDWRGIKHSLKHGLATTALSILVFGLDYWFFSAVIGLIDFVLHYHIDWLKSRINNRKGYTSAQPEFWHLLGADQLAHQLTYIGLVWLTVA